VTQAVGGAGPTAPVIAGYRVEELVGSGGCGEVWRARDVLNGRLVALKRLRHDGPPAERDRLRREAAVLAGLSSPHIVRLLTVVTSARGLVLVLEFLGGGNLASLLRTRVRLAPGEVVTVAAPLAAALAEVHAVGLVHGDVSPANVLFTTDGRPVLSDLGVARLCGAVGADAVTSAYADPAVLEGAPLTPSADVYALAAVCFEALTGRAPYPGDDAAAVLAATDSPRPTANQLVPGVPEPLSVVIESALALDAELRPDAADFAAALLDACPAAPVRLAGATVPGSAPPTAAVRRLPAPPDVVGPVPSRLERVAARVSGLRLSPRRLVAAAAVPTALAAAIWGGVAWAHSGSGRAAAAWAAPAATRSVETMPLHVLRSPTAAPSPVAHSAPSTAASPTSTAVVTAAAVPPAVGPLAAELTSVIGRLDDRRDGAFASGQASLLDAVYAAGSPPLRLDRSRLAAMVAAGEHASGLALSVRTVDVLTATSEVATVRVADVLGPYTLVSDDGHLVHRLAGRSLASWTIRLVRKGSGEDAWRIAAITRA
jgi:eukaryotic-like serine/threonine-protein kinase